MQLPYATKNVKAGMIKFTAFSSNISTYIRNLKNVNIYKSQFRSKPTHTKYRIYLTATIV